MNEDLLVKFLNLWGEWLPTLLARDVLIILILHLEVMELGAKRLMVNSEVVNLSLVLRDSSEELRVGLLSCKEPVDNLIDIGETGSSSDLLESILNSIVSVHLFFHLFLEERREKSVDQELVSHLDLILILVLIGRHVSNLLLSPDSVHSSLKCLLFILDGLLETADSLSSLLLVLVNLHHDLLELHLGLNSILLGFSLLFRLLVDDISLGLHGFLQLLGVELGGDQVSFHSLQHVLVLALGQLLELMLLDQRVEKCLVLRGGSSLYLIELS